MMLHAPLVMERDILSTSRHVQNVVAQAKKKELVGHVEGLVLLTGNSL